MTTRFFAMAKLALLTLLTCTAGAEVPKAKRTGLMTVSSVVTSPLKADPTAMISAAGILRPQATPLKIDRSVVQAMDRQKGGSGVLIERMPLSAGLHVDLQLKPVQIACFGFIWAAVIIFAWDLVAKARAARVVAPAG